MLPIYKELDWEQEATHFASIDRFLALSLGKSTNGLADRFRFHFEHARFLEVPQTGFSPLMLYMLYGIAATSRPSLLLGCGTYAGVAFSMLAAGAMDQDPGSRAIGVDEDEINVMARRNAKAMGLDPMLTYTSSGPDALIKGTETPIDLLFLDVDDPVRGKEDYAPLAELAHPRLAHGAVVLAHDACVARCAHDIDRLTDFVKGTGEYLGPWVLPVDNAGLWMAIKK